ncbi:Restriction of telomere capping protein 4, C-terminal [Phaffia rhodozyma]|uniref:Restriction of telomere capping protein 4 n=1 Tax=Phaffia rhodozyma TaxID=264483 RepID=A0A0F7SJS5_PHARH|nr:Restriction of telomere capping protein 4, C-terminal [Phaffia rhodozyma]
MEDLRRRQTLGPSFNMNPSSNPKTIVSGPSGRTSALTASSSVDQDTFQDEQKALLISRPTRTRPYPPLKRHHLPQSKGIPPFRDSSDQSTSSSSFKRSRRIAKLDEFTGKTVLSDDNEDELGSAQWTENSADEGVGESTKLRNMVDMSGPIEGEEDSGSDEMSLKASSPPPELPAARRSPNGRSRNNAFVLSAKESLEIEDKKERRAAEVKMHQQKNTLPSFKRKDDSTSAGQSFGFTSNAFSSLSSSKERPRTTMKSKKPTDSSSEDESLSFVKPTKRSLSESIVSSSKPGFKPLSAYAPGPSKFSSTRLKSTGYHDSPPGPALNTLLLSTDTDPVTPRATMTQSDSKSRTNIVGAKPVIPFPITLSNQSSSSTPTAATTVTANSQSSNPGLSIAFGGDSDLSDLTDLEDEHDPSTRTNTDCDSDSHNDNEATPKRKRSGKKKTSPIRKVQRTLNLKEKQTDKKPIPVKSRMAPVGLMATISKLTGARSSSSTSLGGGESIGKNSKEVGAVDNGEDADGGNVAEQGGEGSLTVQERIFLQTKAMERDEAAQRLQAKKRPQKIKPKSLCPYCSERLPSAPSAKLEAILSFLHSVSQPSPTVTNPGARKLPMAQSINACALHRSESLLIPLAKKKRWPMQINWENYISRIKSEPIVRRLKTIVKEKEDSLFYDFAKERVRDLGKGQSRSARGQFEVFEKCQPGYFGEIGQILFHQTLSELFIDPPSCPIEPYLPCEPVVTSATASPLTASDFLYFVLIPELTIILIQQDLGLDRFKDAFDVMAESREYGNSRFAAEEGETVGGVLMTGFLEGDLIEENGIQAVRGRGLGGDELGIDGDLGGELKRRTSSRRANGASAVSYEESDTDLDGEGEGRGGKAVARTKKKKRGERKPREESEDEDAERKTRGVRVAPRPRVSYPGSKNRPKQEGSMEIVIVGESLKPTAAEQKRPDESLDELDDYEFEEPTSDEEPTGLAADTITVDQHIFN